MTPRTLALTGLALVGFAGNSLLCRVALRGGGIDAASFTSLRLVSGAVVLALLLRLRARAEGRASPPGGDGAAAAALFVYAAAFSFAYLTLAAGTGSLLLFGAVQATMIAAGLRGGERPRPRQWVGLLAALAGLVALVAPGLDAPDPGGALLMAGAGVAWGLYSLRGRVTRDPTAATAGNFLRTVPMTLLLSLLGLGAVRLDPAGSFCAILSGGVTSGCGYVVWYAALRGLPAVGAASVQLATPVLVAVGGILLLGEPLTLRLLLTAPAILGGIGLVLADRRPPRVPGPAPSPERET